MSKTQLLKYGFGENVRYKHAHFVLSKKVKTTLYKYVFYVEYKLNSPKQSHYIAQHTIYRVKNLNIFTI